MSVATCTEEAPADRTISHDTLTLPRRAGRTAVLLLDCLDRKGILARIAEFLYFHGANIVQADQQRDHRLGRCFMRFEWDLDDFDIVETKFDAAFVRLQETFGMRWKVTYSSALPRVAIFGSRYTHCVADLLHRHQIGELRCDIPMIVSNHRDAEALADFYKVPFTWMSLERTDRCTVESKQLEMLKRLEVDVVVLARYMQVLSPTFVDQYSDCIINVHHSFLPAFSGARAYHAAFEKGVKLIGATSHYVTNVLDDGPIIEQDVTRVSHRDQLEDLIQKGRDLERIVLSRALRWHLEHRVLTHGNKTVVFN